MTVGPISWPELAIFALLLPLGFVGLLNQACVAIKRATLALLEAPHASVPGTLFAGRRRLFVNALALVCQQVNKIDLTQSRCEVVRRVASMQCRNRPSAFLRRAGGASSVRRISSTGAAGESHPY